MKAPVLVALSAGLAAACGGVKVDASSVDLIDDLEDGDQEIIELNGRVGFWYVVNDLSGQQEPFPFEASQGGAGDSAYSARTSGSGFTEWGAQLSLYLNHPEEDALLYDLSGYTGLQFQASGDGKFRAEIVTDAILNQVNGGSCAETPGEPCDDYFGSEHAPTSDWQLHRIPFAEMGQDGWGKEAGLDLTTVTAIEFGFDVGGSFDVAIDDVALYTEE
jgi:hypothetical protein